MIAESQSVLETIASTHQTDDHADDGSLNSMLDCSIERNASLAKNKISITNSQRIETAIIVKDEQHESCIQGLHLYKCA